MISLSGYFLQIYDEFCPLLLNQFRSREFVKFETFDAALDEFYSKIESQRAEQQHKAKEDAAFHKLNKIHMDQVCLCSLICHIKCKLTLSTLAVLMT